MNKRLNMKLVHSFAQELTALGSEVKPIKWVNSRLTVFNHNLAAELNLPTEWQHESISSTLGWTF